MERTQGRRRARVAAVAIGLAAALVAAEVLLRITHFGAFDPRTSEYHFLVTEGEPYWRGDPAHPPEIRWDGDPYGGLPPGARMTFPLNSHGLRGPEPRKGRPNVLLVGDSFTFGEGVAWESTFAARLETLLAERRPPPQTIAAALPGYGTSQEAARLPSFLTEFAPRAVVVVFVPNDPISLDDSANLANDLLNDGTPAPSLRLARLVTGVTGRAEADRRVEEWYLSYYFGERRAAWTSAAEGLRAMRDRSRAAGAGFGVVVFPLLHRLAERPFARIHDAVAATCRELGVPCLDLTDALATVPERTLWVHPTDHHPNARAHALAAAAMAPFVGELLR